MQRAPLPHISPSEPSLLKRRIRKSARSDGSTTSSPSAPTERPRRQSSRAKRASSSEPNASVLLSIIMKSLPFPFIFVQLSIAGRASFRSLNKGILA